MKRLLIISWLMTVLLVSVVVKTVSAICPGQTIRGETGEVIEIPEPGEPGIDYVDSQFIASFLYGYLTLPEKETEAHIEECFVEEGLKEILKKHEVWWVKQVFTGAQPDDTIRVVYDDTCYVPDMSQIYLLLQEIGHDVIPAIEELCSHEATLYAEPNIFLTLHDIPNDPEWDIQWNFKDDNIGISCPPAWDVETGSPIRLAIIDTGVNYNHEDLGGPGFPNSKIAGGYDYANDDNDPLDYYGSYGHGSLCSGIAGAMTNNSIFMAGIAGGWNDGSNDIGAKLYAIKNFYDPGWYPGHNIAARGIWAAADPINGFGCRILSNSWGGEQYSETMRWAIRFAYGVGASFVASKGNIDSPGQQNNPAYPSDFEDYSWITSVASYGQDGAYCDFSNCNYRSKYGYGTDISAPGSHVPSTDKLGGIYDDFGGTSAACPHVAGSIALIRSLLENDQSFEPGPYNEDTDWIIKYSADDSRSDDNVWTWDPNYGHGELRISTPIHRIESPVGQSLWDFYQFEATGGEIVDQYVFSDWTFIGSPFWGSDYWGVRYDVRVNVTYPIQFVETPFVWGLGQNTVGWSGAHPNYQVGFCRLVPNTQTITGCQLQTFVYEVYDDENYYGWFPCEPNEVSLRYRLWGIKRDDTPHNNGGEKISEQTLPLEIYISGNYPNPFNSSTVIKFGIPEECRVSLAIYDLLGRSVINLIQDNLQSGHHVIQWNGKNKQGKDVPTGIYFYRFEGGGKIYSEKMTLIR